MVQWIKESFKQCYKGTVSVTRVWSAFGFIFCRIHTDSDKHQTHTPWRTPHTHIPQVSEAVGLWLMWDTAKSWDTTTMFYEMWPFCLKFYPILFKIWKANYPIPFYYITSNATNTKRVKKTSTCFLRYMWIQKSQCSITSQPASQQTLRKALDPQLWYIS